MDQTGRGTKIIAVLDHAAVHAAPASNGSHSRVTNSAETLCVDSQSPSGVHSHPLCVQARCQTSPMIRGPIANYFVRLSKPKDLVCNPPLWRDYVGNGQDGESRDASNGCTQSRNDYPPFGNILFVSMLSLTFPRIVGSVPMPWRALIRRIALVGSYSFPVIDRQTVAKRRHGSCLGRICGGDAGDRSESMLVHCRQSQPSTVNWDI